MLRALNTLRPTGEAAPPVEEVPPPTPMHNISDLMSNPLALQIEPPAWVHAALSHPAGLHVVVHSLQQPVVAAGMRLPPDVWRSILTCALLLPYAWLDVNMFTSDAVWLARRTLRAFQEDAARRARDRGRERSG